MMLPLWVATPLIYLGVVYVVFFPLGLSWYGYAGGIAFAAVIGAWMRPRYQLRVLERSDRGVVYWVRRVGKGAKPEEPASSVLMPPLGRR